jgi:hypothetical protein
LTNDLSVWITPIAVTAFLLVACAVGGKVAGFMCGLPYTSAPMLYAIAVQHGDAGAIAATRSAIGIKLVFIAAAVIFIYQYGMGTSRITRSVKTSSRPNVRTVFGVGAFALAVCLVAQQLGAVYAGFLAGLPFGPLCVFTGLWARSGHAAAIECARGFIEGQTITLVFLGSLFVSISQIGFQLAFVCSLAGVAALVVLRAVSANLAPRALKQDLPVFQHSRISGSSGR